MVGNLAPLRRITATPFNREGILAMQTMLFAAAACLAVAGTAHAQQNQGSGPITVQMADARGNAIGTVEIRQLRHGTLFVANLRNLPPGPHGFHVHERGVCEAPGFQSTGGHYNPGNAGHGFDSEGGPHAGDLPNIHVTQQGVAMAEFHSERLSLGSRPDQATGGGPHTLLDNDGSAIMIHQGADNYRDMDSAGSRLACGVIKAPS